MRKTTRGLSIVAGLLVLAACGSSDLPKVSAPGSTLDAEDYAVMKATLRDVVSADSESTQRGRTTTNPIVLFKSTVPVCDRASMPTRNVGLPGCVDRAWLDQLSRLAGPSAHSVTASFERRNSRALPIRGDLGDVTFVPESVDRGYQLNDFVRQSSFPRAIVAFSAPAYPAAGAAVVAYRYFWHGLGFVLLRRSGTEWRVDKTSDIVE